MSTVRRWIRSTSFIFSLTGGNVATILVLKEKVKQFPGNMPAGQLREATTMANDEILQNEEESSVITLTDENGVDTEFEYLDCITYRETEYLVLIPAVDDSNEIVILEVQPEDDENENYIAVEDESVLDAVYSIFKDRFQDILTFED